MFDSALFVVLVAFALYIPYALLRRHSKARNREAFLREAVANARAEARRAEKAAEAHLIENRALRNQIKGLTEILAQVSSELEAALASDPDHTGEAVPRNVVNFPIPSQEPRILEKLGVM